MSRITLASRPFKIKSFFWSTIYYAVHSRPQKYVPGVISRPNYEDMIASILVKIKDLAAKITDKHMTSIFGELLPTSETSHFLIPFSVRQAWFFSDSALLFRNKQTSTKTRRYEEPNFWGISTGERSMVRRAWLNTRIFLFLYGLYLV